MPRPTDHPEFVASFGARLRRLRNERGFSQIALAEMVELEPNKISEYECGRGLPTVITAVALAQALNVSLDELLLGTTR